MADFHYRQNYLSNLAMNMREFARVQDNSDPFYQAADEIDKLRWYESLTLVQGREVGDDDDTVALIETPNGESAVHLFMTQVLKLPEEALNDTLVIVSEDTLFTELKTIVSPWQEIVYPYIRMLNPLRRGQPVGTFKPILVRGYDGEREEAVDLVRFKFIRAGSDAEELLDFELFTSIDEGVCKLDKRGWQTIENNGDTCMTLITKAEL